MTTRRRSWPYRLLMRARLEWYLFLEGVAHFRGDDAAQVNAEVRTNDWMEEMSR